MAIMQKIVTHLRIETIPSFLSYSFFAIMREIQRSINSSEKLYPILVAAAFTADEILFIRPPAYRRQAWNWGATEFSFIKETVDTPVFFLYLLFRENGLKR